MSDLAKAQLTTTIVGSNSRDEWGMCELSPEHAADRILRDFVVIARADLPEVKRSVHDKDNYIAGGQSICYTGVENALMWIIRDVAVWQFLEQEQAALTQKQVVLASRRDELAVMFGVGNQQYIHASPALRTAIDYIIEMENANA
jgi:hypothetical protein